MRTQALNRRAAAAVLTCALALLAGCNTYRDFKRPMVRNYAADIFRTDPQRAAEAGEPAVSGEQLAEALARWHRQAGAVKERYQLGTGDVLRVSVYAAARPEAGATVEVPVSDDGDVALPFLGRVAVAGLTAREIEDGLTELYEGRYYRDPVTTVIVVRHASKRVLVSGEVGSPGPVPLQANRITLLEVLLEAGGLTQNAGGVARLTRAAASGDAEREAQALEIDMPALLADPTLQQNVWVYPGDIVHVVSLAPLVERHVVVLGYVRVPGVYTLPANRPVTVMDAMGFARGLDNAAKPERTCILRRSGTDGDEIIEIDLTRVAEAAEPDVVLEPGDIIIVGTSWGRRTVDGILHVTGLRSLATF